MDSIYSSMSNETLEAIRALKVQHISDLGAWLAAHPEKVEDTMEIIALHSRATVEIDTILDERGLL